MSVQTPVYLYIRFSSKRQEKGASRERQREDGYAHAARMGWTVVEVIEDLGRSAWQGDHLKNGNLGRFADRVHAGEIATGSILLVEKLDRLSRQEPRLANRWLEDIAGRGVAIATVDGNRIYDDKTLRTDLMGTFEILMKAKLANDENNNKSERVRDAQARNLSKAADGRIITTKVPGWLSVRPDRSGFEVLDARVATVKRAYELSADGIGARSIARMLNSEGHTAWGKWRSPTSTPTWEVSAVALLLKHPAVEGDLVRGRSAVHRRTPSSADKPDKRKRPTGQPPRRRERFWTVGLRNGEA